MTSGAARDAVERVCREERTRALAALVRRLGGDFEAAEDALQEAFAVALATWPERGIPERPAAWIVAAALRRAVDAFRRTGLHARAVEELTREASRRAGDDAAEDDGTDHLPDDRLRLVFTCCHPALDVASQVALTLQAVGGLTARETARAFLVPEATMAQRLVRVKRKIRDAGIPYRVPPPDLLHERLAGVMHVVYLVFNEGHAATEGASLHRAALCGEAIRLARLLRELLPREPEVAGLLALMLLTDARRPARVSADGVLVPLDEQDRALWDAAAIAEGTSVLDDALALRRPGRFQVMAAISALHCAARDAASTDWPQIAALYDALLRHDDSPVVRLNRAVAVAGRDGPDAGLSLLGPLAALPSMERYQPFHAARADLLRRAGRPADAAASYRRAIELSANEAERRFLERRLAAVGG